MNTYNLNLSSDGPQPKIAGLEQRPPITNSALWVERTLNSKGLYTGSISKSTDTFNGQYKDIFKIKNISNFDWSHVVYHINPELVRDGEKITFDVWTKSTLDNSYKFTAGIAEGNTYGHGDQGFQNTSMTPVSTNGSWKQYRAEKILSKHSEFKKPNVFFGNGYDSVGETVWTEPKITYGNSRGVAGVFKIPDHFGATQLNLNFVNLYDDDQKYIKILVSHNQTDEVWLLQEFNDVFLIKAQTLPVYLYPTLHEVNEYIVTVSAVRTDLQVEKYDIYANIKRPDITNYGDIDIVQTRLYNNAKQSNNLFIAMETENPRYLINSMLKLPTQDYTKPNINLTYFDPATGSFPVYTDVTSDLYKIHGPSNNPSNHFIPVHTFTNTAGDENELSNYTLVFDAKISEGQNYYAWQISASDNIITGSWSTGKEIPGKKYSNIKPLTHEWIRHYVPISAKQNDDIVISMVSSDKSGNPVVATHVNPVSGQTLSLKNVILSKAVDVNPDFVPVEL